jgi:pimeloyl-ACP methyl ester carboxylesterase
MKLLLKLLLVFGALLIVSVGAYAEGPSVPLTGNWTGALTVSGTTLHLICHFTPKPDKTLSGTFDSVDQGAIGLPFSAVRVTGQTVHLEASAIGASFDGTLDAAGKTLAGHWMQGGGSLPLTLTRTDHVASLDRPQEPHPPFPYTSTDVTFPGGTPRVMLAGTLTTPPGAGPFPAVVLIAGSGRVDRNETGFGHKIFLLLADTLTRRGIAVLRYDKRGVEKSTGSYALATTADFAADAQAAVNFLKTQSAIKPKRIGLIGHSEGGLIAPLVASEHPADIAFVVLLAGPGMNGEKIILAQQVLTGKAEGASDADIKENTVVSKKLLDLDAQELNPVVFQAKAQKIILAALTPKEKKEVGDPVQFAQKQMRPLLSPWLRYFLTYDPTPALKKTRCPVLALDGSKDVQVPPAEDLALIGQALKSGGNTNVTVKELPNLNHLFQTCDTGSPSEYAKIPETMAPSALAIIGDWVVGQTGAK